MELESKVEQIKTKEDFIAFFKDLLEDFKKNSHLWENQSLCSFLEAMCAFTEDIDGYYQNNKIIGDSKKCNWKVFAEILLAARFYE